MRIVWSGILVVLMLTGFVSNFGTGWVLVAMRTPLSLEALPERGPPIVDRACQ